MEIAVNGNIIDTETIYKITEIKGNNYYGKESGFEQEKLVHSAYSFDILMFCNRKLTVWCDSKIFNRENLVDNFPNLTDYKLYLADLMIMKSKLSTIRDEIIDCWSKNKTKIPLFEIK